MPILPVLSEELVQHRREQEVAPVYHIPQYGDESLGLRELLVVPVVPVLQREAEVNGQQADRG